MKKILGLSSIELIVSLVLFGLIMFFVVKDLRSNNKVAVEVANNQHFSKIKVVSVHRWISAPLHGCSYIDWKATIINATSSSGENVTFTICEQLMFDGVSFRF